MNSDQQNLYIAHKYLACQILHGKSNFCMEIVTNASLKKKRENGNKLFSIGQAQESLIYMLKNHLAKSILIKYA